MSTTVATKPVMLDDTGQGIKTALEGILAQMGNNVEAYMEEVDTVDKDAVAETLTDILYAIAQNKANIAVNTEDVATLTKQVQSVEDTFTGDEERFAKIEASLSEDITFYEPVDAEEYTDYINI